MKNLNTSNISKHFLNVLLLIITLLGINTNAWGVYVNQQYTCTGYSYSIPSNTGYTWITLKGTSFNGAFSQDVTDNSSYNEKNSGWGSAPSTWDVTATMYAKAKDDYKFVGWYSNNSGSGTALSTSTSNNCYYSTTVQAVKGNSNPARNFYAIFAKFKPSTTVIDFGDVAYNSAPQFKEFTIACHNVGDSWSQTGLSGVLSAIISGNKTDNSEHTCTVRVTINPTAAGIYNQTLSITTPRGGTINVTVKAKVTAIPSYTWNSALDDLYVGQTINDVISFTSNGAKTYSILDWTPTGINNEGATTPTFDNNTLVCGHAGTLTLKVVQEAETNGFEAGESTKEITIKKYTPTFTWNADGKTYYYQSTIPSIFSTTGPNAYTIVSDNEASAKVVDNTLYIYNVDERANITVTQEENYLWAGETETYTVTPINPNNHVEFSINTNHTIFESSTSFSSNANWSNPGYRLGDGGWGTQDDYAIVRFTGIPDKLYFDKSLEESLGQLPGTHLCQVFESNDGNNWGSAIWTHDERVENKNGNEVQLLPTTRYIKFAYHGTVYCNYKNIRVTELEDFSAAPAMIDFGTKGANFGTQEEKVVFSHANAGRVTTMEIVGDDAEYFSIVRSTIPGTGRDLYGTFTIAVRFDNQEDKRGETPYSAVLHIEDNANPKHEINIPLTGIRNGKTDPEFTFNANYLPYYLNTNIASVASSTNKDYANCPLTFETSDASIAEVDGNGTLHIYGKTQEVTITVHQGGNNDFSAGSATFTFTPCERPNLAVPFQMSKAVYDECTPGYKCAWDGTTNEIRLGKDVNIFASEAWDWKKKSIIIAFAGTPGRISFKYKTSTGSSTSSEGILDGAQWMVEESVNGHDWNVVWNTVGSPTDWTEVNELTLNPTTQYVRLSFLGNFAGYFKEVNISELVGYKYLRVEEDGRYLSRGAKWGTQAIVDDFGMACRISNYTHDNVNYYTRFLFVDNQQYLYEADNHELYTDDGTANNTYNLWKQNVIDGTILTFQSGNEYAGDSRKGYYVTLDGDALALTSDEAAATKWHMEDYTEHPAHILEILNREAAEAASHDFASDVTTLEKVRNRIAVNDFEKTDIVIPELTLGDKQDPYYRYPSDDPRVITIGTYPVYDNTISGLVPGFYRLTVKAFSRISSKDIAWACHEAGEGMESVLAYVYANDVKYPIQSLYKSYQASPLEQTDELRGGYFYSTELSSANRAFSNDSIRYLNDVYVYVDADPGQTTGTLHYGIKNPSYVPGAWLVFGHITLTRFARKEYIFNGECEEGETTDWQIGGNWNRDALPDSRHAVLVQHDLVIDEEVAVYSLKIAKEDKEGNPVTVIIAPTGGLTVGAGGVQGATAENFKLQAATTGVSKGQTGYLRLSPYSREVMPEATVQLYSIGYYDKSSADTDENNVAAWQYVGTPIDFKGALAKTVFTRSWIYSYDESSDSWVNNRKNLVMQPFVGYATTQYDSEAGKLLEYKGELIPNTGTHTINLKYSASNGYNVVANSFVAPIDITKMRNTDFVNVDDPTIYLFHTGTHKQAEDNLGTEGSSAGQFISIAIGTAGEMATLFADDDIPTTIAPMQGFGIYASGAGGQVNLDYSKLVWNANYAEHPNKPLRAPQLHEEEEIDSIEEVEITGALKMTISAEGRSDKCYLLESESYDALYEAGYDASKKMSGRLNVFTVAEDKQLAVNATNSIIGTRVGVRTGEETMYTMFFSHLNSEKELALLDWETEQITEITENAEYTFFAEPNSMITDRFEIIEWDGSNKPGIATGVENVENETKAHKFIKDNQLFILKNGVLYNATGVLVR